MRRSCQEKGFTLIELLVVISIIGILSSMIIPVTAIARRKVREMATMAEIHTISAACGAFRADSGQYPPDKYDGSGDPNGVRVVFMGGYNFRAQFAHRALSSRETLELNDSTKTLVFFLGTRFDIMGKIYGPYMTFSLNKLVLIDPSDHVPIWNGFRRNSTATGIRASGDNLPLEIYVRCLKDHFDSCYIYDCHDPEGELIQEQALGAKAHNLTTFDLWSLGWDRKSTLAGAESGGGTEPDRGLAKTAGEEIEAAKFGNDLTNWTF